MKVYFAPMEGITLYPLRNVHREVFGAGVDKYYTPFLTAASTFHFKNREKKDVLPEKNSPVFDDYGTQIEPQIMAGNSENFLWAAREMKKLGYQGVNLNLGCPAPTVVNRHKGAGLLQDAEYLDKMLSEIFAAFSEGVVAGGKPFNKRRDEEDLAGLGSEMYPDISLKTRLGFSDPAEARKLMEVYARYPIKELTIHARVREDYYGGKPRADDFVKAVKTYRDCGGAADIIYNGDVNSVEDYNRLAEMLSESGTEISGIMIGRGLLTNPALARELKGGESLKPDELKSYLRKLYDSYAEYIPEDRNVIFKMLEHWAFIHVHFKDCDKCLKTIRKSRSKGEYQAAVNDIFAKCEFI
ncbi:tRNA-dihydrouridine synthase family protein [Butyrivibrio sp. CB08]|uniref:tRNA dihydrouridine synthase n=1 Tax=Butyrivibrio sp. CB08 TaxID=2364879 RepID=UPI000EAABD5F|nr:tRNA-dihydrouridine synthase family protein [Butyrivibrio sp. CB08]RKM61189.1 tRNA-dihydrouridine synthase family protein [Butyrivibrio sp. CB08]